MSQSVPTVNLENILNIFSLFESNLYRRTFVLHFCMNTLLQVQQTETEDNI